ncbi:MAG: CHAD domain-containing protein [Armatimonadota bacterium]
MAGGAAQGELGPDAPLWAWGSEMITRRAAEMVSHADGVRLGEDIEAVHDMRVWSRRLVAAMRLFAVCFPEPGYRKLMREARRVTRALGEVRDLDVQLDYLKRLREGLQGEETTAVEYLVAVLSARRETARQPMLKSLDRLLESRFEARLDAYLAEQDDAYRVGLSPVRIWGPDPHPGSRRGGVPRGEMTFREAAPVALRARVEELYAFEPYVARPEAVEELHEMRIAAKWLRYTMEVFAPAYSTGLKKQLAAVKKVQELLGDLHDSDVRLELLERTGREPLEPKGLAALGLLSPDAVQSGLHELQRRETGTRNDCYTRFYAQWRKLEERGLRGELLQAIRNPDGGGAGDE